ncbi:MULTISPECIES: ATP-binding cassette domain-containing protein [Prochlorococcus]|uniref:ATP-binding cassette domain-containing protein n=1 Tax=Prochlorococcus TaxID=1218 RepID=UPI0007B38087|nr:MULTISPECIES: ATP-binding cassette domain-containing protein [Prochlorococcus]KZR65302.1 Toxin RTX-I translocation ATP-binding protein [Prochlorococcus marinus str. MIT 1312]KZR79197.1 Toxin RTX-I translocation ATP-binding protein [Prochlorococcus marinus str. MIT 1327]NMO83980.1 ATP-binding cassette domain-containing protein [Prochlorococcus sp. P1344]NMP06967.1 ATP-binding cassette domain-containing protein [Prochlorococcus sp. P1361]NMP12810.1 ATP-binding cassette domain-containing prote
MTTNPGREALLQARALEEELLFSDTPENEGQIELRLLGFCMAKLGRRQKRLEPLSGASIEKLLNFNDIHHRKIELPRDPNQAEYPLLVVFEAEHNTPFALYRHRGQNWLYDPQDESHQLCDSNLKLAATAYEVYPSLPETVLGPLAVLRFAFATELGALTALVITSAVVMLFTLSIPMLTNLLVNRILPQSDQKLLFQGVTVVVLIVIGSMATEFLQSLMLLRLESIADLRLQSAVWDRLMRLPMSFISKYTTGDLASRVTSISQLRQLIGNGVLSTLLSSLFAISFFVLMFVYDNQLALWASAFTLVAIICLLWITWRSIQLQWPLLESGAEITNFSLQAVMGMPQIRSAGSEPYLLVRWLREINHYASLQLRSNVYSDAMEQYGTLVTPLASLFMFAVVTSQVLNGPSEINLNQTMVAFISFNAAFSGFNGALTGAVNLLANVAGRAAVLWRRAEPVLYADIEKGYQPEAIYHSLRGEFRLQGISYEFPESSEQLFNSLTLTIPAGQHTAITGASGCGKTTLVRMLLGFVSPQAGELLVDGIPLTQLAIRAYRRQLGVVMQTARLNSGSIYDVICGGVGRSEDKVWQALEQAALADEVRAMPMQLETLLSDSGGNLSGGQVQRIAIARALITQPKVLIMDEATSALDNRSQELITQTIKELGMTRISIAHRLSTIQQADQIVVLDRNQPQQVMSGTWDELKGHGYLASMLASH